MTDKFEQESNESTNDLLKSVFDSAPHGVMIFKSLRDDRGKIVDFEWLVTNDVASEIVGKKKGELIGAKMLEVLPGNKEAGLFDQYVEVVEKDSPAKIEIFYPGEEINRWFDITAVKFRDGFTVSFQDITRLKEVINEANRREDKYRKLFEESTDAILVLDKDLAFIEANTSVIDLFNYSQQELIDQSINLLFSDKQNFDLFKKEIATGRIEDFEAELLSKGSEEKTCQISVTTITGKEEDTYYLVVVHDITDKIQADRELIQAEKLSMTGKIARTIAHEVRNPLTNLSLALEQLKDEIPDDIEDADLYFNIIERNTGRIGKLITDLLNSSKPKELKLVKMPLNGEVEKALALVQDRIKLLNITLDVQLDNNLTDIALDENQLQVALLNLLINAIEAMKPDVGVLEIRSYEKNQAVYLVIKDNGKGISKEDQSRLFEPFFTSKNEGTGLGLTTVQNIIRGHNGHIAVKSEINRGTQFTLKFKS